MSGKRARIPWSRRIRFRLQSLMIAIGVVCIVLGWVIQRAHVQRDSVWAIQRAGGRVMYAWEWRWSKLWPVATKAAGWPHWLTDHIGIDYLSNVTYVEIRHGASDQLLEQIGQLHKLEYLSLTAAPISDAGLVRLQGLTTLRSLSLADTKITDAGLAHLRGLNRLETLFLDWTRVDDAGIAHLRALPDLKYLSLHLTAVTDGGDQELHRAFPKAIIMVPGWAGKAQARAIDLYEKPAKVKADR